MQPLVRISQGKIRGFLVDGVAAFLGIPYSEPPTGAALFQAPAPASRWDGIRDAVMFGPTAPQASRLPPFDRLLPVPVIPGDNFLNLNVWTADPGGSGMPVMVWIHGGGFREGASAMPWYDGAAFARDGVVLVSFNYRLGAPGFCMLPDAPANLGLRDQLAALAWVQDNIANFGGDPARVTIFGESAGGMCVATLVSLSASIGLFRGAIAQSGAGHTLATADHARLVAAELAGKLGVESTTRALGEIDIEALMAAQRAVCLDLAEDPDSTRWGESIVSAGLAFLPVLDGDLITGRPVDVVANGAGGEVAMMVGTNAEEWRFVLVPLGLIATTSVTALPIRMVHRGWEPVIGDAYAMHRPGASAAEVFAAVITDSQFRMPAVRLAEARRKVAAPTYVYEFAWRTPMRQFGACHMLEIPFVFDTLAKDGGRTLVGTSPPQELANLMHAAWVTFARDGDPGWRPYELDSRAVMTFDHPHSRIVEDPRADERELWNGVI